MFTLGMGLLKSVKAFIGGTDRTFQYVCEDCGAEFESPRAKMAEVDCPECHSTQIVTAS